MPFPYTDIPTLKTWQDDSSAFFVFRSSDHVLQAIDDLIGVYHNNADARPEILFYLRNALKFWSKKVDTIPKNTPPDGTNPTNQLPNTAKFSGSTKRSRAILELTNIVSEKLTEHHGVNSSKALEEALFTTYGQTNHEQMNDTTFINRYQAAQAEHGNIYVYLEQDGLRRRYKLRFRDGLAWRWYEQSSSYAHFDTTDNTESESTDQMTHFVMDRLGRIYAGFDKNVVWFKHSSLIGGQGTLAAGRLRAEHGRIVYVENDSGHYQPAHQQMRNLLDRLRLYGAILTQTKIRRLSDKHEFTAAAVTANRGAWPDGGTGY